ncbi:hypothetical protein OFM04_32515, partial [Escherichia coli]|nr:hypothetical protein [Escherichia coli]
MAGLSDREALVERLVRAGMGLGWFPQTVEAWEGWAWQIEPLERLENRVRLEEKLARMAEEMRR